MKTVLKLLACFCFLTLVAGCGERFGCDYFPDKTIANKDNIKMLQEGLVAIARKNSLMLKPIDQDCIAIFGKPREGANPDKKEKNNPGLSITFWPGTGICYLAQQDGMAETIPTHRVRMEIEDLYAKVFGKDGYTAVSRVLKD